jgi:hypothetical protein
MGELWEQIRQSYVLSILAGLTLSWLCSSFIPAVYETRPLAKESKHLLEAALHVVEHLQAQQITRSGSLAHINRAKAGEVGSADLGTYEFIHLPNPGDFPKADHRRARPKHNTHPRIA